MALLYDRVVSVEAAGLTFEDLRIVFDIEKTIDPSTNRGVITIHNLAETTETLVYERAREVKLTAGYPETTALIFDGFTERIERVRQDLSRQTIIKLTDSVRKGSGDGGSPPTLSGWTHRTFWGVQSVRDIFTSIVSDLELNPGPLDAIPPSATENNWAFSGPASAALNRLLAKVNCSWFEDDGLIRVNKISVSQGDNTVQPDGPTIMVNRETGLIDRPINTDEGAEVLTLLNPAVVIGCQIELESESLSGTWKAVALRHAGGSWSTDRFTTWIELRPI